MPMNPEYDPEIPELDESEFDESFQRASDQMEALNRLKGMIGIFGEIRDEVKSLVAGIERATEHFQGGLGEVTAIGKSFSDILDRVAGKVEDSDNGEEGTEGIEESENPEEPGNSEHPGS